MRKIFHNRIKNVPCYCDSRGFSLISAALLVAVVGIALVPLFNLLERDQRKQEILKQQEIHDRVTMALARFLRNNGRFPCPADPALQPAQKQFGTEQGAPGDCNSGATNIDIANAGTPQEIAFGSLPSRALKIPFQESVNMHNHKFIYAVTHRLTDKSTFDDGEGVIRVEDKNGNAFANPSSDTGAQFALVNPGRDGKGSMLLTQTSPVSDFNNCTNTNPPVSAGDNVPNDAENCDGDGTFVDLAYASQNSARDTNHYDDTLAYTLVQEESTFWTIREASSQAPGLINIVNRNKNSSVGVGLAPGVAPNARLELGSGNFRVQEDNNIGGEINIKQVTPYATDKDDAQTNLEATGKIVNEGKSKAPVFMYEDPDTSQKPKLKVEN